ncbi:MAG: hypothetical protein ACE5H5_02550 [Nitrospinota bacterium]
MTVAAYTAGGAMDWQGRLWEWLERAGDWPDKTLELVCLLTAFPFYLSALLYHYLPYFVLGLAFTAGAWLAEEKRRAGEERLWPAAGSLLRRCLTRPLWTLAAGLLMVAGVWRESIWIALVGVVVLRRAVRRPRAAAPPTGSRG